MAVALGVDADPEQWSLDGLSDTSLAPRQLHPSDPLFPRLDPEEILAG